jgi:predicted membrane-bound spermidine synthase
MTLKEKSGLVFLFIAFAEGATVMACELLGAKMTAPFFGTTLYSWAAVLAVTLGGLAIGYYFGGWLSARKKPQILLQWILISSGLFMILMPLLANGIMKLVMEMSIISGLLISLSVFLLPPVILFGMVSPVIVAATVDEAANSGKVAGRVYAISTVGGVLSTLLLGFYIIPAFGIQWPSVAFGLFLLVVALAFVVQQRRWVKALILVLVSVISIRSMADMNTSKNDMIFRIHSSSEGLLGQVKVADYSLKTELFGVMPVRGLLVNNTWQTVVNRNDGIALLDYIYFMRPLLSSIPQGSDVLLVGLGGGSLCNEIQQKGHHVDVVELDPRLPELAIKYFGLNPKTSMIVDDGRHYIRATKKQYDLVILDVFQGENQPWHLLTMESFQEIQQRLKPGGKLLIEFYGFLDGEYGKAARSVYTSLNKVGFYTDVVATSEEDNIERNFIFVAGDSAINYGSLDYSGKVYTDKKIVDLSQHLLSHSDLKNGSYMLLTDDLPALEKMLSEPALEWRRQLNHHFRNRFVETGQPLFY